MKRRFLSTLFMGLLMVATMGMVTSCKDYDDDIDANKAEIENLKTTLSSLQADLESCKSDCEAQIQAAVSDYTAKIAALKAELETEIANKADQSTVDALESKIDSLQQDYDAKISALQAKDEALQEAIDEVKALAESKVDQSEYDEFVEKYNEALAEWTTWRGGVNDQIDALTKKTNNLSDSLTTAYGKLAAHDLAIQELQDQVDALNKFMESQESKNEELEAADKKQNERIDSLKNAMEQAIQDLKDQIAQAQFGMTLDELKDYMNETYVSITDFNTELATLNTFINKQLTSLVLKPSIYVDGIEGIEYPVLRDYSVYTVTGEEIDEIWATGTKTVNSSNGGVATYHVNPNICDLTGYTIDFYGNDPVTRAGIQYVNPTYTSYDALAKAKPEAFSEGLLSVPFTVNFTEYDKTVKEGKTPMIALQMSKVTEDGTRTVTSDYALLSLNIYTDLILADNATDGQDDHIQQEATELQHNHMFGQGDNQVVKDLSPETVEPTHEISGDTYDINKIVETHYTSADNTVDQKMTNEAMEALGLSYQYKVIKYKLTGHNVGEDEYVTLEDGVLTVVRSKDGKTIYPEGHMPIVRVTLVDGDGNVLKVGYIKFRIAGSTTPVVTENLDETQNVDCNGVVFKSLSVAKVVEDLANDDRIGMTVDQFNLTYKLVMNSDNTTVNQYEATTTNGKTTYSEADPEIGTITIVNNYFNWTLPATYTDTMSVDADGKNIYPIVTYIKYSNGGKAEAYAKIVIPVGAITKPLVSLDNSSKVLARWYKENEMTQEGTGDELTEIHITPEVVGQPGADDEIYYNLNEGFLSQTPTFKFQNSTFSTSLISAYRYVFITKPGVTKWVVTGRSGSTYELTVSEDGTQIIANVLTKAGTYENATIEANEVIATLSGSHNEKLTYNEKAQEKYLASYDILNKNGHKELADGETLKLYLGIEANICDKWVKAGTFTARILRPVDLNTTSYEAGQDAIDNGYYADIMKLFEDPSDWRDQWLDSYWTYYGIDSVQADLDNAYTDAALTESARVAYEPGFDNADQIEQLAKTESASIHLEFVAADDTYKYGRILYTANGATIGAFHVYVPITITYDWGYKVNMGYARIDIANTVNNAKKH